LGTGAEGREAGAVEAGGGGVGGVCGRTRTVPATFGFMGPATIRIRGGPAGVGLGRVGWGRVGLGRVGLGRVGFGFEVPFGLTFERPETFLGFEGPATGGLG